MYIKDGMVYGGSPKLPIRIESVKALDNQILLLTFQGGEQRLFDASILMGTVFEPLKEESIFKNPNLDHGVVTWNNGEIDCAPEFMYEHSYEYKAIA